MPKGNRHQVMHNNTYVVANAELMLGDTGPVGQPGPPQIPTERYVLSYADLPFQVILKTATFAMIEDATNVNGDDLELIKTVDKEEWENIRKMWCAEWHKRRAHQAFEMGLHEEFEAGFVHE